MGQGEGTGEGDRGGDRGRGSGVEMATHINQPVTNKIYRMVSLETTFTSGLIFSAFALRALIFSLS